MKPACAYCCFFSRKSVGHPRNECRRHSPAPRLAADGRHAEIGIGVWPIVAPNGWCGEYKRQALTHDTIPVGIISKAPR